MSKYVLKCYKSRMGYYVYDRFSNAVFKVSEEEFNNFLNLENGTDHADPEFLSKYQSEGAFVCNGVEEIEHPQSPYVEYYLSKKLSHLSLQVTQQCNLRCKYCAYSGLYYNRTHNSKYMTWDTAKKAIDFYLERTSEMERLHMSFYGGEPLLNFNLIKTCVEYISAQVEAKRLTFSMTTNATLLTEEVRSFLHEHDFQLSISLDGDREEHDKNRTFANGTGSFDTVIKNIKSLVAEYPDYAKKVTFLPVISPNTDLDRVLKFFSTEPFISECAVTYNTMSETGLKNEIAYSKNYMLIRRFEYLRLLFHLLGKIDEKSISPMVLPVKEEFKKMIMALHDHSSIKKCSHHGGPCMPGVKRLFVSYDGTFYPCEKVSETNPDNSIGNISQGFDQQKVKNMLNIGQITKEECINCWNLRFCSICIGRINDSSRDQNQTKVEKLKACALEKSNTMNFLYEISVLQELGKDL